MSLFALTKQPGIGPDTDVIESLSGNLCRCTGYRPIIDAAKILVAAGTDDGNAETEAQTVNYLDSIGDGNLVIRGKGSTFSLPRRWMRPVKSFDLTRSAGC